ncbi:Uncharacterised protein [Salmonella enterica subsp. enterica serovar Bovismorbificans]|nr:Uncharacterised protein [Salmonella enterica subsp. enterica serovar Bovismorbificans]
MSQFSRIVHILTHPAVEHQPEIRPALFTHIRHHRGIFTDPLITIVRSPVSRHFTADKAHFFSQIRACAGGVKLNFIAHRSAQQFINRQPNHLAKQIPQRQIHTGNRVHHQTAGTGVVHGRAEHLIVNKFDIAYAFAFNKPVKMFFYDKTAHLPCCRNGEPRLPIFRLYFDNQRP